MALGGSSKPTMATRWSITAARSTGSWGRSPFYPKHNAGVVVQTNLGGSLVPFIIAYNALDRLRGREPSELEPTVKKVHDEALAALAKGKERSDTEQVEGAGPSHDLDAYVGNFDHPGYGRVTIGRNEDGLTFGYNGEIFPLVHYHYDVFHYRDDGGRGAYPGQLRDEYTG